MRIIPLLAVLVMALMPTWVRADITHLPVHAFLVIASKKPGDSDARLAPYEDNLRRILRFESFRLAGEGAADLAKSRRVRMDLSHGHTLDVTLESIAGRYSIEWQAGGKSLMNTRLALRPGVPALLGGPATQQEGEVWAVILLAE